MDLNGLMGSGGAAGTYRIEVRRRHLKDKGNLLTGRLNAPLVPVDIPDLVPVEA